MFGRRFSRLSLAAALSLLALPSAADQVVLDATADNSIYSEGLGLSNGAGTSIFTGQTIGAELRRALIRFDIASAVPAGSTINSAELRLTLTRSIAGANDVAIHRVLADWGEGASVAAGMGGAGGPAAQDDATWGARFFNSANPPASVLWTNQGGDFNPVASATTTVELLGDTFSWTGAGVTADVQAWLDTPALDFGWIVIGNEAAAPSAQRFASREETFVDARPQLVIDFTPPSTTGACDLPDGSCTIDTEANCIAAGGTYQGDGTNCPDPMGACCMPDGSCVVDTEANCIAGAGTYQGDGSDCVTADCPVILTPYVDALTIPPIAQPTIGMPGGSATYDMSIVQTTQQLHSELPPTTLWTYEGVFPGPTFLASANQPITVNWFNDLRDEMGNLRTDHLLPVDLCPHGAEDNAKVIVHFHGGHVAAEFDGYPEDTFLPGESKTDEWPMEQRAGLSWYHDHSLGQTRLNVYLGLAGAFIIRDPEENALGLPSGEFEVPLIIMDRSFNPDGSLEYPEFWQPTFFGDYNLVNGVVTPFHNVKQASYRFRVLNGANSRTYTLRLSNGQSFQIIGVDGGLLSAPQTVTEFTLAPAERADLIVDFSAHAPGTEIELVNDAPSPFPGTPGIGVLPEVMKFVVGSDTGPTYTPPAELATLDFPKESEASVSRDFFMQRDNNDPCTGQIWTINGLHWDHITERPFLGSTEIWRFINPTGMVHPMHLHLVNFKVLDRVPFELVDGEPVATGGPIPLAAEEEGWKDTVRVGPGEMVRVIARFEDFTGKFAYHCHLLEHEDHEMMRQFEVIPCPADINETGSVDPSDFTAWLACFNNPASAPYCGNADVNGDGTVDPADFTAWLAAFSTSCPN